MIYVQIETDISIPVNEDYQFGITCGEYNVLRISARGIRSTLNCLSGRVQFYNCLPCLGTVQVDSSAQVTFGIQFSSLVIFSQLKQH